MPAQTSPIPPHAAARMPMLVKASIACHAGAGIAVAADPALWPWALGAVALNHGVISVTGLLPRSTWLGENMRRLPASSAARNEVSITIDDGPDPAVTPAVLDLLDAHGARATFFCIAQHAAAHPALAREIVRRGHSVQNHSDVHRHNFSLLGLRGYANEIGRAQQRLADVTGVLPRFFRAPAGLRNPFLAPVLQRLDLTLVSWTRRGFDTVQRDPQRVLQRLTRNLAAGDIVLLHDGHAARTSADRPVVLDVLPPLLQRFSQAGLRAVTLPDAVDRDPPRPA
jgi:peptidoglycan/xylan/chitin deacetylase (PgdA/CDA1 family)